MDNFNKIMGILESYEYSKTYYDIEKSIAKLGLMEIRESANKFYNKNEIVLVESGLDKYYINEYNITESVGYVAKSIMQAIVKGLVTVMKSIFKFLVKDGGGISIPISAFAADGIVSGAKAGAVAGAALKAAGAVGGGALKAAGAVGGGVGGAVAGAVTGAVYMFIPWATWKIIFKQEEYVRKQINKRRKPEEVEEISKIISNALKNNKFSCSKYKEAKIQSNTKLYEYKGYINIATDSVTDSVADPFESGKWCSINLNDLLNLISRFESAKDLHDFQQLVQSLNTYCNKAKQNGVKVNLGKKKLGEIQKKIADCTNRLNTISKEIESKDSKNDNDTESDASISSTLKLAHEALTGLKVVTSKTMELYKKMVLFKKEVLDNLEKYFKNGSISESAGVDELFELDFI